MATIFQRLNRTFGRGVTDATSMQFTNASDKYADLKPNDVIYTTDNEQDYQQKLLQLRQQRLLSRQWKRAQYETQNNALANLSQVQMMYREADLMDAFPEVGSAIDIYMEEACLSGDTLIKLATGEVKTIQELYESNTTNFTVYAVDENKDIKFSNVEKVICKGKKTIYVITLTNKQVVRCTPDHKWLTVDNVWCEAQNLTSTTELLTIDENFNQQSVGILTIEQSFNKEYVYDLYHSSVNSCFGVICGNYLIFSHNCYTKPNGLMINVTSKSERIKSILEDLIYNRLSSNVTFPMVVRSTVKYGNTFMLLNITEDNGIIGWSQLPVYEMQRFENGMENPYSSGFQNTSHIDVDKQDSTKFVWVGKNEYIPYRNWQIAHFRLLYDSLFLPYGCIVGDAHIETEDGYKLMKDITIGDKVWTFNINTQKRELGEVTIHKNKGIQQVYHIGTSHNEIEATEDHKFLTYDQTNDELIYKEVCDLKIGDLLIIDNTKNKQDNKYDLSNQTESDFKTEKIRIIEEVGKKEVFDFTVNNDNSNFFANGIVTHNCSVLNKARRHFRMLSMMEDMMLMYRLDRSIERRVFKIDVGDIDPADVQARVEAVANEMKRTPIIDPTTGQLDLRKSLMSQLEDYFIPVRDPSQPTPIETLAAGQNMTAMDDIKFVQGKLATALRVPLPFLNFSEATGDGKNLAMLDVRFTRTINRIQQMMLMELNKVCIIHLYLLGFTDELNNFQLTMNNPSSQAELMELENLSKKIEMAKSAVADPGGGLPIYSVTRAQKEILGWGERQISDNLEELRLEKAISSELEQTASIIKRTGFFDKVDNVYGTPGATYQNGQPQQGGENGLGGGSMGSFGGPSFGGGFGDNDLGSSTDIGGDDSGEISGEEGSMDMGEAADMESANTEPLQESYTNILMQKAINEQRQLINERANYYKNLLIEHHKKDAVEEMRKENVPIYEKNFLVNQELNSIANELEDKFKRNS